MSSSCIRHKCTPGQGAERHMTTKGMGDPYIDAIVLF